MTFKKSGGKKSQCDAKCYNAKNQKCVCCCGGKNHGVGFNKAFRNTLDQFEEMAKNVFDVKKNEKLFDYFKELKKQTDLFKIENDDELISIILKTKIKTGQ